MDGLNELKLLLIEALKQHHINGDEYRVTLDAFNEEKIYTRGTYHHAVMVMNRLNGLSGRIFNTSLIQLWHRMPSSTSPVDELVMTTATDLVRYWSSLRQLASSTLSAVTISHGPPSEPSTNPVDVFSSLEGLKTTTLGLLEQLNQSAIDLSHRIFSGDDNPRYVNTIDQVGELVTAVSHLLHTIYCMIRDSHQYLLDNRSHSEFIQVADLVIVNGMKLAEIARALSSSTAVLLEFVSMIE